MFGVLAMFPERGVGIQQMNVKSLYLWFLALAVPNALSVVIFYPDEDGFIVLSANKNDRRKYQVKKDKSICALPT